MLYIIDTPRDSSGSVNLASLLLYPPTDEIDLANHLFYQQVFGDTSVHLATYLPHHHDGYTDSENLEGTISGQAGGIMAREQSLGSPMPDRL